MRHALLPLALLALVAALCASAVAAAPAGAALKAPFRAYFPFEKSLHSCRGAANPFMAAGNVSLRPGGAGRGKVAHFTQGAGVKKAAMVIDGVNLPADQGTVGLWLRCSGKRHWSDGKRMWLAVLVPQVGEGLSITGDNGTGLTLFKDKDNALVLGAYQFYNKRLTPGFRSKQSGYEIAEPDRVLARVPAAKLPRAGWVPVRIGWDRKSRKAWLGAGRTLTSAAVKYRPAPWLCLLVGTPPRIALTEQRGFDGDVDDLCVDARTPAEARAAGLQKPAPLPPEATTGMTDIRATRLAKDPLGAKMERLVRMHLANVTRTQEKHGGWTFSGAMPSGLWFLSGKVVIPYTHDFFNGCKDGNSAACAMRLLMGYYALGDRAYVEAAEKTAATLLRLQGPGGYWHYYAVYDPVKDAFDVYRPDLAPFEDHVQSHPTLLLWLLHGITRKEVYKKAADKGRDFILRGQNPNGSWSHHYNLKLKCGQAARGYKNAGEINDDTTGDQMLIMLASYRMTGEIKYLRSFLRGADWIHSAFVDRKAKGWAQQYDKNNRLIEARHFEPAAISLSEGIHSAPRMLMLAYRLTGERRYLEPCVKWRQWMLENRVFLNKEKTKWGWHLYYDPDTGEPYRMSKRKRLPVTPNMAREGGYTYLLREIANVDKPRRKPLPTAEYARRMLRMEEHAKERMGEPVTNRLRTYPLIEAFNWKLGTWLFAQDSVTGAKFSPSTIRVALVSWNVFVRRQLAGQIAWDAPDSRMPRLQWADPLYHLVPYAVYAKPLTPEELRAARAKAVPVAGKPKAEAGPNLLKNPGLKMDPKTKKIESWWVDPEPKRNAPKEAPAGSADCLRVDIATANPQPGYIGQVVALPKDRPVAQFVLTGKVRSTRPGLAYLQVKLLKKGKRTHIVNVGGSKPAWREVSRVFKTAGADSLQIICRYTRLKPCVGQTVWFADIALRVSYEPAP